MSVELLRKNLYRNYNFDPAVQTIVDSVTPLSLFLKFKEDKEKGKTFKTWNVIPPHQYKNILFKFMTMGDSAKMPLETLNDWFLSIIVKNTAELQTLTDIFGHSDYCPFDDINSFFNKSLTKKEEVSKELEANGFKTWALLPDGIRGYSDYAMNFLWKIISEYKSFPSAVELLVLINRVLNLVHDRSDLSLIFIKGGKRSCSDISNAKFFSIV